VPPVARLAIFRRSAFIHQNESRRFIERALDWCPAPFLDKPRRRVLVELEQPSRQCTTLGTTPERIKKTVVVLRPKSNVTLAVAANV
jgi:hypothetical protein